MKIKHFLYTMILSVIGVLPILAQTRTTTITLKGIVADSTTQKPMAFAAVTLLSIKDSSAVTGGLTNSKGEFNIPDVRIGSYKLRIAFLGYKSILNPLVLKAGTKEVTIGPFNMVGDATTLGEVVIIGQQAPVVVKTDTVEFTAVNFKTEKNDVVEEMIKKLPGVQVDKDGNIQAHGKDVTKVLVDGKPFFGNDPKLATQNLPAEMIDKIQVIDQKSDQAQFTKIDDGNSEKVINIITKMGYKRGNFGKLSLGGGNSVGFAADDRYDLSGMFNSFKDDRQLSVIGMSNNTNVTRFTADMGASMSGGGGNRGGNRGGGGGGFGFGGNGINVTNALGVNFKNKIGKLDFASSYFYNGRNNNNDQFTHRKTLLADSSFLTNTKALSSSNNTNHRFNMQMDYMVDSSFSIRFVPNISIGNTSSSTDKTVETTGKINPNFFINKSTSQTSNAGNNLNASGFVLLRKQFKKPRRTLSLNLSGNYSVNDGNGYNNSDTKYFSTTNQPPLMDSTIVIQQNNITKSNSTGYGLRFAYTEPINTYSSLQLDYSYNSSITNSDKKTFDFDGTTSDYTLINKRYSSHFENSFTNQRIGISIQTRKEKFDYAFGLGLEPTTISSKMLVNDTMRYPKMNVVNFSPLASLNYNFSKNSRLRLEYRGRANQPDISQLQPLEDNSNPLLITKGNPNLLPEFSNNVGLNFNAMNYVNFSNYYVNAQVGNTMNRITNMNTYGKGGVQTTIPVNVNGGYNTMLMMGLGRPFKLNKYVLNTFGMLRYSKDISFASQGGPSGGGREYNLTNMPPQNVTSTLMGMYNLGFTINMKRLSLTSSARVIYNNAAYTIQTIPNTEYVNYAVNLDAKVTVFGSLRVASDVSYTTNNGLSAGFNQNTILWNGSLTQDFFKDKRAQIKVQLYDILGQNVSIRRNTTENYIEDVQSKVLTRYFLISFIYNFNKFLSAQKAPAEEEHRMMPGMRMGGFHGGHD